MGARKRAKPNPPSSRPLSQTQNPPLPPSESSSSMHSSSSTASKTTDGDDGLPATPKQVSQHPNPPQSTLTPSQSTPRSTRSWYGGTLPRMSKATPSTAVDLGSISAARPGSSQADLGFSTPDPPRLQAGKSSPIKDPAFYLARGMGNSSNRSLPLSATTAKLNKPTDGSTQAQQREQGGVSSPAKGSSKEGGNDGSQKSDAKDGSKGETLSQPMVDGAGEGAEAGSASWLGGWLAKSATPARVTTPLEPAKDARGSQPESAKKDEPAKGGPKKSESPKVGPAKTEKTASSTAGTAKKDESAPAKPSIEVTAADGSNVEQESGRQPELGKPWFGLWGASTEAVNLTTGDKAVAVASADTKMVDAPPESEAPNFDDSQQSSDPLSTSNPARAPTWAFWSKEKSASNAADAESNSAGEMAVAGTASQSHPEPATVRGTPSKNEKAKAETIKLGKKRTRPISLETNDGVTPQGGNPPSRTNSPAPVVQEGKLNAATVKQQMQKLTPTNLLLPSFKDTYHLPESPSILEQIARLLNYSQQPPPRHVHLVKDPPKIKKALAIGVHGYFPAPLIQTVLGRPTGTSIKFANHAADAIRKWADAREVSVEIEKVALEGEGKISERVDLLWKLLLNWIDHINRADFILVACHSQGVPVAIMLVAKLIEFGCIHSARVGICAMAGVNLGPFQDYRTRLFGGSAAELFEFSRPDSEVSRRYENAIRIAVRQGVRIVYAGSIDDQLVSLESSTFSTVNHPYIYRAVFIDGRVHAPDFITHLVGFALKLRNLGISDHGLTRELSSPLAGSLYTGEGHSRLYDDSIVYELAVAHALETTAVGPEVELGVQPYEEPTNANPFILPWAMRGVLEEEVVRRELWRETEQLLRLFEEWRPSSKVLKDVKFRLEAVKSKL